jgi:hypothetical protein
VSTGTATARLFEAAPSVRPSWLAALRATAPDTAISRSVPMLGSSGVPPPLTRSGSTTTRESDTYGGFPDRATASAPTTVSNVTTVMSSACVRNSPAGFA